MRSVSVVLAAIFCLSTTTEARAQLRFDLPGGRSPDRILVFVVRGQTVDIPVSAFQDVARQTLERHLHARVVSTEEAFVRGGTELQARLAECRGEDACYARLAAAVDVAYLLVITASRVGDIDVVGARLLDLALVTAIGNAVDPVPPDATILEVVPERIRAAVPQEMWEPFGSIAVDVQPDGSEIIISGKVIGVSPIDRIVGVLPGSYQIAAKKAGHVPAQTDVEVLRGEETALRIALEPESSGPSWLIWAAIGVGAAGAAVAAALLLGRGGDPTFCSSTDPALCAR